MSRSFSVLDVGEGDVKGDPWPFICASRVSIGIGDGGGIVYELHERYVDILL